MSIHPGPPVSGPRTADQIGSTTDGGRETDLFGSTRRCGRCIRDFPVGAEVDPMELRDWWVCPACVESLMPSRGHRTPA
jgi:hypothetical protein